MDNFSSASNYSMVLFEGITYICIYVRRYYVYHNNITYDAHIIIDCDNPASTDDMYLITVFYFIMLYQFLYFSYNPTK